MIYRSTIIVMLSALTPSLMPSLAAAQEAQPSAAFRPTRFID
jgi:hypothetical protein